VRAYRCRGCGRGLTVDIVAWGHCPKCGSGKWNKLQGLSYWEMLKVLWLTRGKLLVPPQGSLVERFATRFLQDEKETGTLAQGGSYPMQNKYKGGSG